MFIILSIQTFLASAAAVGWFAESVAIAHYAIFIHVFFLLRWFDPLDAVLHWLVIIFLLLLLWVRTADTILHRILVIVVSLLGRLYFHLFFNFFCFWPYRWGGSRYAKLGGIFGFDNNLCWLRSWFIILVFELGLLLVSLLSLTRRYPSKFVDLDVAEPQRLCIDEQLYDISLIRRGLGGNFQDTITINWVGNTATLRPSGPRRNPLDLQIGDQVALTGARWVTLQHLNAEEGLVVLRCEIRFGLLEWELGTFRNDYRHSIIINIGAEVERNDILKCKVVHRYLATEHRSVECSARAYSFIWR